MNAKNLLCFAFALTASVAFAAAEYRESAKLSAIGSVETLDIEGGRLVEQAVQQLILSHGYRISYEDPRYANGDDLEDITQQVTGKAATNDSSRIIAPKSRKMSIKLQTSQGVETALNQVVNSAAIANPGARFRVQKEGAMFHVLPTGVRDRNGNIAPQESLLDTRISLELKDRTAYEALRAICATVTSASGKKMTVGSHGYIPYPGELRYPVGANDEPARDVLKRLLDAIAVERGQATWLLLYGNQQTEDEYALNIMQLPDMAVAVTKPKPKVAPTAVKRPDPAAQDASSAAGPGR